MINMYSIFLLLFFFQEIKGIGPILTRKEAFRDLMYLNFLKQNIYISSLYKTSVNYCTVNLKHFLCKNPTSKDRFYYPEYLNFYQTKMFQNESDQEWQRMIQYMEIEFNQFRKTIATDSKQTASNLMRMVY